MIHASTISMDQDSQIGKIFIEKDGLKLLINLLENRVLEDNINWKIM